MRFEEFKSIFCDIFKVLEIAAPNLTGLVGTPVTKFIIALLASIAHCEPCNHREIADKLNNDPDLYTKLERLDKTHFSWLDSLLED